MEQDVVSNEIKHINNSITELKSNMKEITEVLKELTNIEKRLIKVDDKVQYYEIKLSDSFNLVNERINKLLKFLYLFIVTIGSIIGWAVPIIINYYK